MSLISRTNMTVLLTRLYMYSPPFTHWTGSVAHFKYSGPPKLGAKWQEKYRGHHSISIVVSASSFCKRCSYREGSLALSLTTNLETHIIYLSFDLRSIHAQRSSSFSLECLYRLHSSLFPSQSNNSLVEHLEWNCVAWSEV